MDGEMQFPCTAVSSFGQLVLIDAHLLLMCMIYLTPMSKVFLWQVQFKEIKELSPQCCSKQAINPYVGEVSSILFNTVTLAEGLSLLKSYLVLLGSGSLLQYFLTYNMRK